MGLGLWKGKSRIITIKTNCTQKEKVLKYLKWGLEGDSVDSERLRFFCYLNILLIYIVVQRDGYIVTFTFVFVYAIYVN
jgi:hypothetical protein